MSDTKPILIKNDSQKCNTHVCGIPVYDANLAWNRTIGWLCSLAISGLVLFLIYNLSPEIRSGDYTLWLEKLFDKPMVNYTVLAIIVCYMLKLILQGQHLIVTNCT